MSTITELDQTPEPPSNPTQSTGNLNKRSGPTKLKLTISDPKNASMASEGERQPDSSSRKVDRAPSTKQPRRVTGFSYRELILLALYIEPRRKYGEQAVLPHLNSRAIVDFIEKMFPVYHEPENKAYKEALPGSLAAQCSTHVSRGILAKTSNIDQVIKRVTTVYYANPSSAKFLKADEIKDLEERYQDHVARLHPQMLHEETTKLSRKRRFTDHDVPDTPSPKKRKSGTSFVSLNPQASPASVQLSTKVAKSPVLRAARKNAPSARPSLVGAATETSSRLQMSALRMRVSKHLGDSSQIGEMPAQDRSSPDPIIADSAVEPTPKPAAVRGPLKDEPRAYSPDPLDDLLKSSLKPSAEEQELLDLLPILCDQEAASDASKMAEKNFEIKDFFEHWPEYHPENFLFDSEKKIQEIKQRPNKRQILGKPYLLLNSSYPYRPYAELSSPNESESESTPPEAPTLRNSSPKKNFSPRKREAARRARAGREESIIHADDIEFTTFLDQTTMETTPEKKVSSWQEALGMPNELIPGFVTDFTAKKGKRLVMEVPLAVRGRSRNWFKAILPED
jgi:hypothetical protein